MRPQVRGISRSGFGHDRRERTLKCAITINQAAIVGLFRRMNRYVGNLPPMPGVFPDYLAPVTRGLPFDRTSEHVEEQS
jgi:hypothetical protein